MTDARTPDAPRPGDGGRPPGAPSSAAEAADGRSGLSFDKADGVGSQAPSDSPSSEGGQGTPTGYGAPQYGPPEQSNWQATGAGSYPPPGSGHVDSPPAYGAPDPSYGAAQGGYSAPPPGQYGGGYEPPAGGYTAPPAGYGAAGYAAGGYGPPGGPGAPGAPGAPGGPGTPPPAKKKRTGLIIGLVAGGLVVVVAVAIGLVVLVSGGGSSGGSGPQAVVQTYLQALAAGDAAKALEQGEKPSDTNFVTAAALKTQNDIAKISGVSVSSGYTGSSSASVSATYKFGNRQASERFSLTKIDGDWKLDATTYPVDVSGLDDVPGLTVLGIEVGDKSEVNVFPGPLTWGSTNEYISVKDKDPSDYSLSPGDYSSLYASLETGLTDAGEKAVAEAVSTFITNCAASKDLEPANCPQDEYDYDGVAGTATWTPPADLSGLQYQTSSPVTTVYISGDLTWSVTYTSDDGLGTVKQVTDDAVDGSLYGTVDLAANPPVYSE